VLALLEDRLSRDGRATVLVTGREPSERAWLDALGPASAVLAVAIGRDARVAEAAVAAARAAGAPAVVLVDSGLSALARAPLARVVPADARGGHPSLVAMIAVAQSLASALAPVRQSLAAVGA
jgi:DNA-binding MurR/RpiR family transcriptional regulator